MKKADLQKIMRQAWQMVKLNGFMMAEGLRVAWYNFKLRAKMAQGIVKFYFVKIDGSKREAYGTLNPAKMPEIKGTERRTNPTIQTYYDTEKQAFRCYKLANLVTL